MNYVVTIDGPAGAGKSSAAKALAKLLNVHYLDTGAIYRSIALILDEAEIKPDQPEFIAEALRDIKIELRDGAVLVNDIDISGEIRTPHVDKIASDYSAVKCVRDALLHLQQEQQNFGSLIAEGRDVGSVVFPNADIKFYLTASPEARAKRRCLERELKGEAVNYDETLKAIKSRDEFDSKRENSPLKVPDNAIIIDTSEINEQETLNLLAKHVKEILKI
ncbi:MAG: (d)CMP kinase [Synergistaceae bacterium]|nr:(d)CMP kinase [Synergistaceae bacterium]MBQ6739723.1 (d)CMP kinase [Synergistaceae bacterium]